MIALRRFVVAASIFGTACSVAPASSQRDETSASSSVDLPPLDVPSDPNVTHAPPAESEPPSPVIVAEHAAVDSSYVPRPVLPPAATDLDDMPIPETPSSPPKIAEWIAAPAKGTTSPACGAKVVREWLKITCSVGPLSMSDPIASVRALSGDAKGLVVSGYIPPGAWSQYDGWFESYATVIVPLRRGDRRLFELTFLQGGKKLVFSPPTVFTISEVWLEAMKSPEISVTHG